MAFRSLMKPAQRRDSSSTMLLLAMILVTAISKHSRALMLDYIIGD